MSEKTSLRQHIRHQRTGLDDRTRHHAALAVAKGLFGLRRYQRARRIGAYIARNGEMDTRSVLDMSAHLGKHTYLPVLHPFFHGRLKFCELRSDTILRPNRFGIPEPATHTVCLQHNRRLDLVLVPLVAFDRQGYRLGMGGGYYDRSFAYRRHSFRNHPLLIGVAYEFQRVDSLPHEPWDVQLDAVITDQQLYCFNPVIK